MSADHQRAIWDEENRDYEIYKLWKKEIIADDKFRDNQEWGLSWDYFKAGYLAGCRSGDAKE